MTGASAAPPAQSPGAPAAPNESIVTACVTNAVIIDSTTLGMAPSQRLCALTLNVLSMKATGDLPSAIRATDKTVRVYTKDVELTRLKDTTITATITLRGDERSGRLWLVRIEDPKAARGRGDTR